MYSLYKIFLLLLLFITSTVSVSSQNSAKEEKSTLKKARKLLANEEFKDAQEKYLNLLQLNPNDVIYNFEGGLSYYFADFERGKSVLLFEAALANTKEDTIPELYYYLARAYHLNGDYEKSKEAFTRFKPFIKRNLKAGQELMKQSDYFINISNNGKKYLANKNENAVIKNLGSPINTPYGEYAPVIKKGDNVLLFTSRRKNGNSKKVDKDLLPYEDVYVAKLVGNDWQLLTDKNEIEKYMPKDLNTKKHDAGIIYSSDGNTLYTYKNDLIWKSILENGKWSDLIELDKNINTSQYNIPSVNLSKDEKTLYFVSTRKDGIGGKDIYKSVKKEDGNWDVAEILNENINTKLDEDAPYISEDGKTLYFASKGHEGIGGYDLFKSKLTDSGWGEAENMGIPVNSPLDDIYLILDAEEQSGYFASTRDGGLGGMDIYSLCMDCPIEIINKINGILVDNNEKPINKGTLSFRPVSANDFTGVVISNGKFKITTKNKGKQEITVNAQNYENQSIQFELPATSTESDLKLKLHQIDIKENRYQVLNITSNKLRLNQSDTIKLEKLIVENNTSDNVNDNNSSDVNNSNLTSYQEFFSYNVTAVNTNNPKYKNLINKAIEKAKNGQKIYIEIESSASKVPTKTFKTNINLSSLRGDKAKSTVLKSLTNKGISEDKISFNAINSIISGPDYLGDYKNTKKYSEFQYVKISIK